MTDEVRERGTIPSRLPVELLLVSGSLRDGSVNAAVVATAASLVPDGVDAIVYDALHELPLFSPDLDLDPLPAPVVRWRAMLGDASALLICTPEYAGTLPAALKNALEWTVGSGETTDLPTAWINASTGPTGAAGTHETLDIVLGYTGAEVVADACARIPVTRGQLDRGRVADDAVRAAIATAVHRLLAVVDAP